MKLKIAGSICLIFLDTIPQVKGNFNLTGTKPIKKVAEARARKRKRAMSQLKAAKKQAASIAENSELSEKQKLQAISKAMAASRSQRAPGKVLVVAKKMGGASVGTSSGGSGKLKFVDKRSKKDTRALKRAEKRGGKKGGKKKK